MDKNYRIAILGCGWAGERHARAFVQCGAQVTWAVDTQLRRAENLSRAFSNLPRVSIDYQQALEDPCVDAVSVCLPHNLHAPVSIAAARAGKHILVEKPIAATLEEADQMIDAALRAGVTLMVAENELFRPSYQKVKELLDAGAIGRPALLLMTRQCYLTRSFLEDRRWFLSQEQAAGGMMMSGGVHDFSTARMLFGDIESVYALRAPQRFMEMEGDDTSAALARFQNGVVGSFALSYVMKSLITAAGSEIHTLRVDGELGSIRADSVQENRLRLFSERKEYRVGETIVEHEMYVPQADTFYLEIRHFLDCVHTGATPIANGPAMRKSLEAVLAAYRSMQTGQVVKLENQKE